MILWELCSQYVKNITSNNPKDFFPIFLTTYLNFVSIIPEIKGILHGSQNVLENIMSGHGNHE